MNFAFLLIESPHSLKRVIEFLFSELVFTENRVYNIIILTKIDHDLILVNKVNPNIDIHHYTYSKLTKKIFEKCVLKQNTYFFIEAATDLAQYSFHEHCNLQQIAKINACIIAKEDTIPEELYVSAKFLNPKLNDRLEFISYLRSIGKLYIGSKFNVEKSKKIFISRILINLPPERYAEFQSDLTSVNYKEKNSSAQILELINKSEAEQNMKCVYLLRTLPVNQKHIVFGRFSKHMVEYYNMFHNYERICFLYSKTNLPENNRHIFNKWIQTVNGVLFLSIDLTDIFWSYDIKRINSIIIVESYNDDFALKFHELVQSASGYSQTYYEKIAGNFPKVDIITLCYSAPDGTELIEEEYFKILSKRYEIQKFCIHLLKKGFTAESSLELCNALFDKELYKSDYERLFHKEMSILKIN